MQSRVSVTSESHTSVASYVLEEQSPREMYELLEFYYYNNGLYDELWDYLYSIEHHEEELKPLRNPAMRAVEFYPRTVWPGQLPDALFIETDNPEIVDPLHQVWRDSNWQINKQRAIRHLALYGDMFLKVFQRKRSPIIQLLNPKSVSEFDTDSRGFITYVRIDVQRTKREVDGSKSSFWRTEEWNKDQNSYRVWEHKKSQDTPTEVLGEPTEEKEMSSFGVDFVPVVHVPLWDITGKRGMGVFTPVLDKINEANRIATRLHLMLWRHNRVLWALSANYVDPSGRPMPPPQLDENEDDEVELGKETMIKLPGYTKLDPLVPNIAYGDALEIVQDQVEEIEKDLPELAWWRLRDRGDELSGRAVQLLLADAISRAEEARANAVKGLVRADQMALTIGKRAGVFEDVGEYEDNELEHTFKLHDIIPISERERAETQREHHAAGIPLDISARRVGWTSSEIEQMKESLEEQERASDRRFNERLMEQGRVPGATPDGE